MGALKNVCGVSFVPRGRLTVTEVSSQSLRKSDKRLLLKSVHGSCVPNCEAQKSSDAVEVDRWAANENTVGNWEMRGGTGL